MQQTNLQPDATSAGLGSPALLDARGMTRRFGGLVAVNDVSFSVREEEIFGLIGPNGAGKTTLFNLITGLTPPSSGMLLFRGENITGQRPHQIAARGIARTFQNIRLFGNLSALENVMIARPYPHPQQRVQWHARAAVRTGPGAAGARAGARVARARRPGRTRRRQGAQLSLTATSAGWRSRARWRSSPSCCCSTSRPLA